MNSWMITSSRYITPKNSTGLIVRKGVPAPPFLRCSPLDAVCHHPFLKSLFPLPSFLLHPLKVFQSVPPTLTQPPPALIQPTNLPYTQLTGLNKYQKGNFTSSTVACCQKSIFHLLNPCITISGYFLIPPPSPPPPPPGGGV